MFAWGCHLPPHAVKRFCVNCSNIKILVNKQVRKINEHKIIIPCNTPEGKRYREVPSYSAGRYQKFPLPVSFLLIILPETSRITLTIDFNNPISVASEYVIRLTPYFSQCSYCASYFIICPFFSCICRRKKPAPEKARVDRKSTRLNSSHS